MIYKATAALIIVLFVVWRVRTPERWFAPNSMVWIPIRRGLLPALDRLKKRINNDLYAEYEINVDSLVGRYDDDPVEFALKLKRAGYEQQPLAALGKNWNGDTEFGSYAKYIGDPPFTGAPDWLKPRQVHVRTFSAPNRGTIVTAHEEYNPWRIDKSINHYRARGIDVNDGVSTAKRDL